MDKAKQDIWKNPLFRCKIDSPNVKPPEMLLGCFIGPFGALPASGIFTGQLQNYLTSVLKLDLAPAAQSAISISYTWMETVSYAICALFISLWAVEKDLPEEQDAIARRKT